MRWYPWTIDAIRLLNRAGFLVFVVTNQGGIGLGFYTEDFVRALHAEMGAQVAAAGGRVDGWFYCPHHPLARVDALRVDCDCRKPRPGMIRQAADAFDIDLPRVVRHRRQGERSSGWRAPSARRGFSCAPATARRKPAGTAARCPTPCSSPTR